MVNINSIVDFSNHPIDDSQYIYKCNSYIKENSILVLDKFIGVQVEIGVASKDGSSLKINDFFIKDSNLPVTSYVKKPDYTAPKIEIIKHNLSSEKSKDKAILGNEVIYNLPGSFDIMIKSSYDIEKSLYGVDFGKATEK